MKHSFFLYIIFGFGFNVLCACNDMIKNDNGEVLEEIGTEVNVKNSENTSNKLIGTYVGMFEPDYGSDNIADSIKYANATYAGESFIWTRENKISISIDEMNDGKIKGHSVVAGNERKFEGDYSILDNKIECKANEPGDDTHDGTFTFTIIDTTLIGTWRAFKKINIQNRKYTLRKKTFAYNAEYMLDSNETSYSNSRYVDWTKPAMSKEEIKKIKSNMTAEEKAMYEEFEENTDFASATDNIYKYNASKDLLNKDVVANMKRGDIYIIRNTIYARHGYSFKYRPLRVFFDKQSWYVPFTTNIQSQFSEIEKKNIELLLKYEKNAKEYYDSFGRG